MKQAAAGQPFYFALALAARMRSRTTCRDKIVLIWFMEQNIDADIILVKLLRIEAFKKLSLQVLKAFYTRLLAVLGQVVVFPIMWKTKPNLLRVGEN
jgi:hypothetical protein